MEPARLAELRQKFQQRALENKPKRKGNLTDENRRKGKPVEALRFLNLKRRRKQFIKEAIELVDRYANDAIEKAKSSTNLDELNQALAQINISKQLLVCLNISVDDLIKLTHDDRKLLKEILNTSMAYMSQIYNKKKEDGDSATRTVTVNFLNYKEAAHISTDNQSSIDLNLITNDGELCG